MKANAATQGFLELGKVKVGMIDKDHQMRLEASGGASRVDVVVGVDVIVASNAVHVVLGKHIVHPSDIAHLELAAHRAGLSGRHRSGHDNFKSVDVSCFLTKSS